MNTKRDKNDIKKYISLPWYKMSLDLNKTATVLKLFTVYTHNRYVTVTAIHCYMYITWKYVKISREARDDGVYSSMADDSHESDVSTIVFTINARIRSAVLVSTPLFSLICKFGLPFRWPLHDFLDKIWNGYIRIKFKLLENKSNSMFHGLFKHCKPAWTYQYLTPKVDYLRWNIYFSLKFGILFKTNNDLADDLF